MFVFQTVVVCVFLTIVHECAHAFIGINFLGLTPEFIAIGIPYTKKIWGKERSTHLYTWKREGKIPIVISALLIGGGVAYKNEDYYKKGRYRQKWEMLLAGPVSNVLLGFITAIVVFGFVNGLAIGWGFFSAAGAVITAIISHGSVAAAVESSHFMASAWYASILIGSWWQPVSLWLFWNFMVALFNLLPIPGLDGGQVVTQGIQELGGEKVSGILKKVDNVALIFWIVFTFLVVMGMFHL